MYCRIAGPNGESSVDGGHWRGGDVVAAVRTAVDLHQGAHEVGARRLCVSGAVGAEYRCASSVSTVGFTLAFMQIY